MNINPLVPLILIPWDHLFKGISGNEHVITITTSMGESLRDFRNNPSKGIMHFSNKIEPSCFFDECLTFSDTELEETYESVQKLIRSRFSVFGTQQWLFGNRFLLKEFEYFFKPEEVQCLEPANITVPYTLLLSDKGKCLTFSYPVGPEDFICQQ